MSASTLSRPWLCTDIKRLRQLYPLHGGPWCARKFNRAETAIHKAAQKHGIRAGSTRARSLGQLRRYETTAAQDLARFESQLMPVTETGCWLWLGVTFQWGGTRFSLHGQPLVASRWIFEHLRGQYLARFEKIRRTCAEPSCVNPWHWQRRN